MNIIPPATLGLIGGSGTFSTRVPPDANPHVAKVVGENIVFNTPFGPSPPFVHFALPDGRSVLSCRMHGWRPGISRRDASLQIFSVFGRAGTRQIIAEGGVGTVHEDWTAGSIILPDDYIDWSARRDASLTDDYLLIMRDPLCPEIRTVLARSAATVFPDASIIESGVYAVTDGRHFESRAEVRALASFGADVIGQSLAPEVYLAREIGACYAGLHQVVNRAEGIGRDWDHDELRDIFHQRAPAVAEALLAALAALPTERNCHCRTLRKETLLREPSSPTS